MFSKGFLASLFLLSHLYPLFAFNKFFGVPSKGYKRLPAFKAGESVGPSSEEVSSSSQLSHLPQPSDEKIDATDQATAVNYVKMIHQELVLWVHHPRMQLYEPYDLPFRKKYLDDDTKIQELKAAFDAATKKKEAPTQLSDELRSKIDAVLNDLSPRKDEPTYETDLRRAHYIRYLCLLLSSGNTQLLALIGIHVAAKPVNLPKRTPAGRMYAQMIMHWIP